MNRLTFLKTATVLAIASSGILAAQSLAVNEIYSCNNGSIKLRVTGCTGSDDTDLCGVQHLNAAGTAEISPKTSQSRKAVLQTLQACQLQSQVQQKATAAAPKQAGQTAGPAGPGGFKVGDSVQVNTLFGWANAKVLAIKGNSYLVRAETGADVWKDYPLEVRRIGPANAEDHANGVYELHDRVQVLFEGKWVDSEVVGSLGADYQVTLPGNRTAWANREQLKYVGPQVKPAVAAAGTPPKPGLTTCAGKFDGRYSTGTVANMTVTFRGAKATISMYGESEDMECWMGGGQIHLHKTGEPTGLVLDINKDGSLDSPMGELKKKSN